MSLKVKLMQITGRTLLRVKQYSPELLIVGGVVGFVGTVVLASTATLKMDSVLEAHNNAVEDLKENAETLLLDIYDEKDLAKDLYITKVQTVVQIAKIYAPAVTLGVLSVACFLTSYNIMKSRQLAMAAAYKALESSFASYRKRVNEVFGEDVDKALKLGVREETYLDENGVEQIHEVVDGLSAYKVLFNSQTSSMWSGSPGGNGYFISAQQTHANNILHSRGHVFLNEVYGWLGLAHTEAGALTGWVRGNGDDFIDFSMYILNEETDVLNTYRTKEDIVLDFNVDGPVYNLLPKKAIITEQ